MFLSQIQIIGHIGALDEKRAQNGEVGYIISVAVNKNKEGEQAVWYKCSCWGRTAKTIENLKVNKGAVVLVVGNFNPKLYNGKTYYYIDVADLQVLKPSESNQNQGYQNNQQYQGYQNNQQPQYQQPQYQQPQYQQPRQQNQGYSSQQYYAQPNTQAMPERVADVEISDEDLPFN